MASLRLGKRTRRSERRDKEQTLEHAARKHRHAEPRPVCSVTLGGVAKHVPDPSDSKDEDENEARGWEDEGRERHGEEEAAEVLRICEAAQHSAMRVGEIVPLNLSQGTERGLGMAA